jgi:hypothetical protein
MFDVTIKKDYQIYGSTDLTVYDLIIITGFAPNIGYSATNNIKNSGIPLMIIEYWDFWYSYKMGLLNWDSGDYYGTDTVELIDDQHPITIGLDQEVEVYDESWAVLYGASLSSLSTDTEPLIYSWASANEVAVIVDDDRKIVATGIYDTTHYSDDAWELFDSIVEYLVPSAFRLPRVPALVVANQSHPSEVDVIDRLHLLDFYDITTMDDDELNAGTALNGYAIIILMGTSPNVSAAGLSNIASSDVPVLVISDGDCAYANAMGLSTSATCTSDIAAHMGPADEWDVRDFYGTVGLESLPIIPLEVYQDASSQAGIDTYSLGANTIPLFYAGDGEETVSIAYDPVRNAIATGIADTSAFTASSWLLFDVMLVTLAPVNPPWATFEEAWDDYQISDFKRFLDDYAVNPSAYSQFDILLEFWRALLVFNGFVHEEYTLFSTIVSDHSLPFNINRDWIFAAIRNNLSIYKPTTFTKQLHNRKGVYCGDGSDSRADCADERWLIGQNYYNPSLPFLPEKDPGSRWNVPVSGGNIKGTDLGISVTLNGKLFFYMGDTWGCGSLRSCFAFGNLPDKVSKKCTVGNKDDLACKHHFAAKACDDAILYTDAFDENDINTGWITALNGLHLTMPQDDIAVACDGTCRGYIPLVIDGVNERDTIDIATYPAYDKLEDYMNGEMGVFNTPTGAGTMSIDGVQTIVLWYASGGEMVGESQISHSWLACSINGMSFDQCPGFEGVYFSTEKFMQVAPVPVTALEIDGFCDEDPSSVYCSLLTALEDNAEDGMLLYGASSPYRCGKLYMAFLYEPTTSEPGPDLEVLYFDNADKTWKAAETDIEPIWAASTQCETITAGKFKVQWNSTDTTSVFGEISADLVADDGNSYIVLLSNHNDFGSIEVPPVDACLDNGSIDNIDNCVMQTPIQMRMARLKEPHILSAPKDTTGEGYGPYIIKDFTRVDSEGSTKTIKMAHVLSAWKGGATFKGNMYSSHTSCWGGVAVPFGPVQEAMGTYQDEPYGVFVRPLEIANGSDGTLPKIGDFF